LGRGQPLPVYAQVACEGPPHDPMFTVSVSAGERQGIGVAGSKRVAERLSAEHLMGILTA